MSLRDRMLTALAAFTLAVVAAGPPALAQAAAQGRLDDLRKDYLCQLQIGGFIQLTKPESNPAQADLDLMNDIYGAADQVIYESDVLAAEVGAVAAKQVLDELLPAWYAGLKHGDGQPDKAAILRADLTPGLRACVARAQTLPRRPG